MRLPFILKGTRFAVWALDLSDEPGYEDCPAKSFIEALKQSYPASSKSLAGVLQQHGDQGPIRNEQKSRELRDGIYEFKSQQGARLLWFYDRDQMTILTHGFTKGAKLEREVEKARELRARWKDRQ